MLIPSLLEGQRASARGIIIGPSSREGLIIYLSVYYMYYNSGL
jgi:hypothetical protein